MTQKDAVEILRLLKSRGIEVWVDGGWGVDVLLGQQTRLHNDIDVVVREIDIGRLTEALESIGYKRGEGGRPFNFVLTDNRGGEVDVHAVVFDSAGNGLYGPQTGGSGTRFPASAFAGEGMIDGEPIRCMTAEYQVADHAAYELRAVDFLDVYALHRKFGIPIPEEFVSRPTPPSPKVGEGE